MVRLYLWEFLEPVRLCERKHIVCTYWNAGSLKLVHSNGKLEKATEAHSGAVLCVRWSPDGKEAFLLKEQV
jgi:hypothetical protein